ncbi:Alpha-amylase precursor [Kluyvera cryocrescens]|uniref:Alpha-amylase n=1 Tax=Kluyvera cryocrescens TaxID=580 RepID=A0A485AL02_KLUCR|nr:Alpha-amylase precursor [Kluyvera cryocrescens]
MRRLAGITPRFTSYSLDRFVNGDPSNDNSYGRHKDGMQEIGTFHGRAICRA